jgi:hypothetical protein
MKATTRFWQTKKIPTIGGGTGSEVMRGICSPDGRGYDQCPNVVDAGAAGRVSAAAPTQAAAFIEGDGLFI